MCFCSQIILIFFHYTFFVLFNLYQHVVYNCFHIHEKRYLYKIMTVDGSQTEVINKVFIQSQTLALFRHDLCKSSLLFRRTTFLVNYAAENVSFLYYIPIIDILNVLFASLACFMSYKTGIFHDVRMSRKIYPSSFAI